MAHVNNNSNSPAKRLPKGEKSELRGSNDGDWTYTGTIRVESELAEAVRRDLVLP
jgi:hypothetical protein